MITRNSTIDYASVFAKIVCLAVSFLTVVGCSDRIHEDFVPHLIKSGAGNGRDRIVSLSYDDKAKYLAVGRESGTIDVWDAKKSQSKIEIKAHEYRANGITFSSDGRIIFSNSYFEASTKLWSAKSGELLHSIPGTRGPVCRTLDENIYLVGNTSRIHIFELEKKQLLPEEYESSGVILVMAMDVASRQVAVGTASGTIEVWKFQNNESKPGLQKLLSAKPYATGDWVVGLQFSAGGETLYSVARSGQIDEWDARSLKKRRTLSTALKHIFSVAFLRDRQFLALGGTLDEVGVGKGAIDLISLTAGTSTTRLANTNLPVVEFLAPLDTLISAQSGVMDAYSLPVK